MKNISLLLIVCFLLVIFSCSNSQEEFEQITYTDTIKAITDEKAFSTNWTEEIDPYILSKKNKKSTDNINPGLNPKGLSEEEAEAASKYVEEAKSGKNNKKKKSILLPEGLFLSDKFYIGPKVYPFIEGFASLDLSTIKEDEFKLLTDFLTSLKDKNLQESLILPSESYLSTILQYELETLPQITNWIIGSPHKGKITDIVEIYEVPVRLFFDFGFMDILIDLALSEDKYFIEQVRLGIIQEDTNEQ